MDTISARIVDEILRQLDIEACFVLDEVPEGDKIYAILVRLTGALLEGYLASSPGSEPS